MEEKQKLTQLKKDIRSFFQVHTDKPDDIKAKHTTSKDKPGT